MTRFITRMWIAMRSQKGQSLVEYALILALVAVVIITGLTSLGGHVKNSMSSVSSKMP